MDKKTRTQSDIAKVILNTVDSATWHESGSEKINTANSENELASELIRWAEEKGNSTELLEAIYHRYPFDHHLQTLYRKYHQEESQSPNPAIIMTPYDRTDIRERLLNQAELIERLSSEIAIGQQLTNTIHVNLLENTTTRYPESLKFIDQSERREMNVRLLNQAVLIKQLSLEAAMGRERTGIFNMDITEDTQTNWYVRLINGVAIGITIYAALIEFELLKYLKTLFDLVLGG